MRLAAAFPARARGSPILHTHLRGCLHVLEECASVRTGSSVPAPALSDRPSAVRGYRRRLGGATGAAVADPGATVGIGARAAAAVTGAIPVNDRQSRHAVVAAGYRAQLHADTVAAGQCPAERRHGWLRCAVPRLPGQPAGQCGALTAAAGATPCHGTYAGCSGAPIGRPAAGLGAERAR